MSYLALYRKYRPQTFEEVVGQNKIIKILENSINNNMVSHAYLFSGPRGTGKTTTAKLIAKLINCENRNGLEPCDKCESCISYNNKNNTDIIEIDAASNNGVDEIREIKEKVDLMPSISKYKVYIIDEVHMLSIGAFNALLKTLEEPPKHVIFILATTEFYKVPETIVSRCQCFSFERIEDIDIIKRLKDIVEKENLNVSLDVLKLIAEYSDGGLRDAINMLDKLICSSDEVTVDDFYEIRGLTKKDDLEQIIKDIRENNIKDLFDRIDDLNKKGKNLTLFSEELMVYLKDMLIKTVEGSKEILTTTEIYKAIDIINETTLSMKNSSFPKIILEVGLIKIIDIIKPINNNIEYKETKTITSEEKKVPPKAEIKNQEQELEKDQVKEKLVKPISLIKEKQVYVEDGMIKFEEAKEIEEKINKLTEKIENNRQIRINNAFATADKNILETLKMNWNAINNYSFDNNYSQVCSYLIDGSIKVAGANNIIISVQYSSILKNALVNIEKIEELFELVMNHHYNIAFILEEEWNKLKEKYIQDIKNGIKYELKKEQDIDCNEDTNKLENIEKSDIVKTAEDLFGNDCLEIK